MACGTGKTLTGLKITEKMTAGYGSVLVLVPSISLLNQTLSEWAAQCSYPYSVFGICSDPKASKITEDEIIDTMVPATTNVEALCHQYNESDKNNLQLFFSTYQSINVIHDFQKKSGVQFDLVICDEAHRTTGVTLAGEDDSNFVRVHDNEYAETEKTAELMDNVSKLYEELISFSDLYDSASFEAKKMIVNQLIRRVDVYRGYQLNITFNFDLTPYIEGDDTAAC